jgi:hypothetical protein
MNYQIYQQPPIADRLAQGDILGAKELAPSLRGHQDFFADSPHLYRYVVLTQSCDLLPEQGVSDYICLAVVRRLDNLIGRRHVENADARKKTIGLLKDLYLHNQHRRGLFFLPANPVFGIEVDSAIDLRVAFSVHKLHYRSLLLARLAGFTDLYAAKLGHMFGFLFNRVATPGWRELHSDAEPFVELDKFVEEVTQSFAKHENEEMAMLKRAVGDRCSVENCGSPPTTYRWIRFYDDNDALTSSQLLLCAVHATQTDENMGHKVRKRPPNRDISET